jgi:hypothetical protein
MCRGRTARELEQGLQPHHHPIQMLLARASYQEGIRASHRPWTSKSGGAGPRGHRRAAGHKRERDVTVTGLEDGAAADISDRASL